MTIQDDIRRVHIRAGYQCERCGKPSTEVAHSISKGKYGRKTVKTLWEKLFKEELTEKELDSIIHHRDNVHASCKGCNDYFNIHISNTAIIEALLIKIHDDRSNPF